MFAQSQIHRRLEETGHAAAFRLGAKQRRVGIGEQRIGVRPVVGEHGDADAETDAQQLPADRELAGERRQQAFGERRRFRPAASLRQRSGQEFVAAQARQERVADDVLHPSCGVPQKRASPVAWPKTSLISLKRSRSMHMTAKPVVRWRCAWSTTVVRCSALNAVRLGKSVNGS